MCLKNMVFSLFDSYISLIIPYCHNIYKLKFSGSESKNNCPYLSHLLMPLMPCFKTSTKVQ